MRGRVEQSLPDGAVRDGAAGRVDCPGRATWSSGQRCEVLERWPVEERARRVGVGHSVHSGQWSERLRSRPGLGDGRGGDGLEAGQRRGTGRTPGEQPYLVTGPLGGEPEGVGDRDPAT